MHRSISVCPSPRAEGWPFFGGQGHGGDASTKLLHRLQVAPSPFALMPSHHGAAVGWALLWLVLKSQCHGTEMYFACISGTAKTLKLQHLLCPTGLITEGHDTLVARAVNSTPPAVTLLHKAQHAASKSHACSGKLMASCRCKAGPCCAGWQGLAVPVPAVQDQPQHCQPADGRGCPGAFLGDLCPVSGEPKLSCYDVRRARGRGL